MKRVSLVLPAVLLFGLLGCASSGAWKTESVTAPGADLTVYRSFGWQAASVEPGTAQAPVSIADANIHNAIRTQLMEKGYREVASEPDLRIGFETAAIMKEKVSSPVRIGIGMGSWGGNVGGGVGASVPVGSQGVVTEQETRLTIRAVDPKNNAEVWVGSAAGDIAQGLVAATVDEAVADILAEFPDHRQ